MKKQYLDQEEKEIMEAMILIVLRRWLRSVRYHIKAIFLRSYTGSPKPPKLLK